MAAEDADPPAELAPGTTFGRYRVVRLIGAGGMGLVYEAVHTELDKRVALKVLRHTESGRPQWRARFLREGMAAARIRHPHVTEVFDVGEQDGALFLVMEFLEGESLTTLLEREGVLPVKRAVDLLLPVCAALSVAHEQGVVHRDLKPDNILLATSRRGGLQPKLLDFGISKVSTGEEPRITNADALLGTPHYMSPEQAAVRDVDARSDQYSLGVLLYECVTGRRPFEAETLYPLLHAISLGSAPRPRSIRPEIDWTFEAVIVRAMALDPDARFADMSALGRALLPFASRTARGLWQPVFGDEETAPFAVSTVPEEPINARPTLPATAPVSTPPAPLRRAPFMAAFVALAFALAGATLVAVNRPPRAVAALARQAPVTAVVRAEPAPVAPVTPAARAESAVFFERSAAPAVTVADDPPRSRRSSRGRWMRGPNRAPIIE